MRKKKPVDYVPSVSLSADLTSIAGEDLIATQLDLARAYIEMGKKIAAKKILDQVMAVGNDLQQQEARELYESRIRH